MAGAFPKILIVDDDSSVLAAFKRCLRKQFEIDVAVDATAALAMIRNHGPYTVVLSDLQMPGVDGIQFLAQVAEYAPKTTRLALTGTCEKIIRDNALVRGKALEVLSKPCELDEVSACLQRGVLRYRALEAMGKLTASSSTCPPLTLQEVGHEH